jgi:hypothetical protein
MRKLLILLIIASVSLPACRYAFGKRVKGNGNVTTEQRSLNGYDGVNSHGPFDVYISQDSGFKVSVEAEDNLLPYIETYVENGVLNVRTKDGYWLNTRKDIKIHVSAPSYSKIRSVGSGNIVTSNMIQNSSKIEFESTGSGDIRAQVNAPEVESELTGSGSITINGDTKTFTSEINGSGDIHAYDLKAETVSVGINGSGSADVYSSVNLKVSVNGSGDVRYKGNGQVSSSIHGSGSVKKTD